MKKLLKSRRTRSSKACRSCYQKKIKCAPGPPAVCDSCKRKGWECIYPPANNEPTPSGEPQRHIACDLCKKSRVRCEPAGALGCFICSQKGVQCSMAMPQPDELTQQDQDGAAAGPSNVAASSPTEVPGYDPPTSGADGQSRQNGWRQRAATPAHNEGSRSSRPLRVETDMDMDMDTATTPLSGQSSPSSARTYWGTVLGPNTPPSSPSPPPSPN